MLAHVLVQLFTEPPRLGTVLAGLIAGQIHPLLRKRDNFPVSYMFSRHILTLCKNAMAHFGSDACFRASAGRIPGQQSVRSRSPFRNAVRSTPQNSVSVIVWPTTLARSQMFLRGLSPFAHG